jgi:hypothetical protein
VLLTHRRRPGPHGLVTLHNDRHNAPWPAVDELPLHLITLHTGHEPRVIAAALHVTATNAANPDSS